MNKKISLKMRAQMFLERNKENILIVGSQIIMWGAVIFGGVAIYKGAKSEEEKRQAEKAAKEAQERQEFLQKMLEEWEARKNAPENQLTDGGWVSYDGLNEPDAPFAEAQDVPLESMGQFGEDIRNRYQENFPEWKEIGMPDPDALQACISISVYEREQPAEAATDEALAAEEEQKEETAA